MFIIPNGGDLTQLDCVDTSVNTWTYMTLMERSGLFAFHRVAPLSYGPVRNTAVLQEVNGGYFAIDASLVDVGVPPPIMPLAVPLGGFGSKLDAIYDFHARRGIKPQRGHGRHDASGSVVRWCSADPAIAAALRQGI